MDVRVCQRPGCGREIGTRRRRDARWCSRSCESKARRQAARKAAFEAANPGAAELLRTEGQSLADLNQRARRPDHWSDIDAGQVDDDLPEFSDYHDLGVYEDDNQDDNQDAGIVTGDTYADPYDPDTAWRAQRQLAEAVERIEAEAERQLRPYREALRRNPGVKPVAMARLEAARDAEILGLTRDRQKAEALETAARMAPQHAVQAAERQAEYAALNAFGGDLPGGSRRHQEPDWSGRHTDDIAVW